jgi:hypothetical protein
MRASACAAAPAPPSLGFGARDLVEAKAPLDEIRRLKFCYRSSGTRPVRLAMRASMRGPISSRSWKAQTKSG